MYCLTYVTGFAKTCIVHTLNFSTLVTHKYNIVEMTGECETCKNCRATILVSLLNVSNLYAIPCGCYELISKCLKSDM